MKDAALKQVTAASRWRGKHHRCFLLIMFRVKLAGVVGVKAGTEFEACSQSQAPLAACVAEWKSAHGRGKYHTRRKGRGRGRGALWGGGGRG